MALPPEVVARVGEPKKLDGCSEEELKAILKAYYDKLAATFEYWEIFLKIGHSLFHFYPLGMRDSKPRLFNRNSNTL